MTNERGPARQRLVWYGAILVVGLGMLAPSASSAQVVRGLVVDAQTGDPVAVAEVMMREKAGDRIVRMVSRADGSFSAYVGRTGKFALTVTRLGYDSTTVAEVELNDEDDFWIALELAPQAIDLPGLTVTQSLYVPRLFRVGYYKRKRQSLGTLFEPDNWERRFRVSLGEMVRRRNRSGARCPRALLYNGAPTFGHGIGVSTYHIVAIEIYHSRAEVPAQWVGLLTGEECGLVAVWTR